MSAPTELMISTSLRATWLWAPDEETAQQIQQLTGGRCRVVDVDIGVDALA